MEVRPRARPDDLAFKVADGIAAVVGGVIIAVSFVLRFVAVLGVLLGHHLVTCVMDPRTHRALAKVWEGLTTCFDWICEFVQSRFCGSAFYVLDHLCLITLQVPMIVQIARPPQPIISTSVNCELTCGIFLFIEVQRTVTVETDVHLTPNCLTPLDEHIPALAPVHPAIPDQMQERLLTPPSPEIVAVDVEFLNHLEQIDPAPLPPNTAVPQPPTDIPIIGPAGPVQRTSINLFVWMNSHCVVGSAVFEPDDGTPGHWFTVIVGRSVGVYKGWCV
jgi:hypothetical protein